MARTILLQQRFERMIQDIPRYELPADAVWNLVDYIPDLDAGLRKRGGWTYFSNAMSGVTATYISMVTYAPFIASPRVYCMTDNNKFLSIAGSATPDTVEISTAGVQSICPPAFHSNKLIICADDGTTAPKSYDQSTFGALAGSPPAAKVINVWKDRTILGNTSAQPTRTYFSAPADPTTWDTTNGWISTLFRVTGYAPLPNALMVFMENSTARIRGSIPPPGSDFIVDDPVFNVGCTDARSIATQGPVAIFANPGGVYLTNGSNIPQDLTQLCGVKRLWQSSLTGYSPAAYGPTTPWSIAGCIYRNYYYVTVMQGSAFVDAFWFDFHDLRAGRLTNIRAMMLATARAEPEIIYAASRAEKRILNLSSIWIPSASQKNDADGTIVAPSLETAYFLDARTGKKTWRALTVEYDLRDAASDNPFLTVYYLKDPTDSYTSLSPTLGETSKMARGRVPLRFSSPGIALKIGQDNASSDTRIVSLSADVHSREPSRLY